MLRNHKYLQLFSVNGLHSIVMLSEVETSLFEISPLLASRYGRNDRAWQQSSHLLDENNNKYLSDEKEKTESTMIWKKVQY